MKTITRIKIYLFMLLGILCSNPSYSTTVVGWVESVVVYPKAIDFEAKLDTGAKISSLNSETIEIKTKGGKKSVVFDVRTDKGVLHTIELPLVRYSRVKRHFADSHKRPVVLMHICLGKTMKKVEVNLVDRSRFKYQLLLGKNFLSSGFLVDSSRINLVNNSCMHSLNKDEREN
ncbi:MAG: ATP-dependent zinc protease [Gammaproteobacteria bacterium]|nr:ATP-dependent zinc protease [Gammaproteobacteria bacterium]